MRTRRIGTLEVTEVGLGCNNFGGRIDGDATDAVVGAALDAGVNFFDTADVYGDSRSEELLGRALGHHRSEVVVATKFGIARGELTGGAAPGYVRSAVDASLRRLGTDYIDLYQLHRPDPDVPIAATLGALAELVAAGKVREIGCSNFTVDQLDQAAEVAGSSGGPAFASVQNDYSLLHREPEDGVLDACGRLGIAFLPYFPLASGLLTGKYRAGEPAPRGSRLANADAQRREREMSEERMSTVAELADLAESVPCTLVELAFSWLLTHSAIASVIAGATSPEQVRVNVAAADVELSTQLLERIDEIAPHVTATEARAT